MSDDITKEELENCCPLCGGKITEPIDDLMKLYKGLENFCKEYDITRKGNFGYKGYKWTYKLLKIKLKMIEMGLIPK